MKRFTKIAIGVVAVAAVAVGGISVAKGRTPKGVRVKTAKVERRDLVSLITANGTIQAQTKVDLSANVMGQITRLEVEEGQEVKKGDLLLVIDQIRYSASVDAARSNLQALEAELTRSREAAAQTKRDLDRVVSQFQEGIISEAENDRARSTYDQALASAQRAERQVAQARADLAAAADSLEKTEIRAPISGVVTRRNVEQGEVVVTGTMNNAGTQLMTISDMSTVEAVLEVDQTDVPQLEVGQPAQVVIDAFPGETFPGVVSEIGSSPIRGTTQSGGQATGTDYEVKVTLSQHPEGVRPGLTVTADITTDTRNAALAVPIGALVLRRPEPAGGAAPTGEGAQQPQTSSTPRPETVASRARDIEGVYVVEAGKVAFRPTKAGIKGEMDIEIVEGVAEGDEIVVGPFRALRELKPGAQVVVDNTDRPGPQG
jgi:HlyD family secretion protein